MTNRISYSNMRRKKLVNRAYRLAEWAYEDIDYEGNKSFILFCEEIAERVCIYGGDEYAVLLSLMLGFLDKTSICEDVISLEFGDGILGELELLTRDESETHLDHMKRIINSNDSRVKLVTLCRLEEELNVCSNLIGARRNYRKIVDKLTQAKKQLSESFITSEKELHYVNIK